MPVNAVEVVAAKVVVVATPDDGLTAVVVGTVTETVVGTVVAGQSVVAAAGRATANAPTDNINTASTTGSDRGKCPRTAKTTVSPTATNAVAKINIDSPPLPVTGN